MNTLSRIKRLILLIVIVPLMADAQDSLKGYISINAGPAKPLGSYASQGNAVTGFNSNLSFGLPLFKYFGVSGKVDYCYNAFNINVFNSNPNLSANSSEYANYYGNPTSLKSLRSNSIYTVLNFSGGLFACVPVKKIIIDFRLLGGAVRSTYPGAGIVENNLGSIGVPAATASAFSIDAGAGVRFTITSKFLVLINLDYLYANPFYHTAGGTIAQNISLFTVTTGIGYQF